MGAGTVQTVCLTVDRNLRGLIGHTVLHQLLKEAELGIREQTARGPLVTSVNICSALHLSHFGCLKLNFSP